MAHYRSIDCFRRSELTSDVFSELFILMQGHLLSLEWASLVVWLASLLQLVSFFYSSMWGLQTGLHAHQPFNRVMEM